MGTVTGVGIEAVVVVGTDTDVAELHIAVDDRSASSAALL